MNEHRAHFKRVAITRALGIARGDGFAVEGFSSGINIIHGPNGSGKSTLSKVLQKLLWPDDVTVTLLQDRDRIGGATPSEPTVEGQIVLIDGDASRLCDVRIEAGRAESLIGGIAQSLPVGGSLLHARYRMPITELLIDDNTQFAREIIRQVAGGVDLTAVATAMEFSAAPPKPRKLRAAVDTATEAMTRARQVQSTLHGNRAVLEELREKRTRLEGNLASLTEHAAAKQFLLASIELQSARFQVAGYASAVSQLTGNEGDECKRISAEMQSTSAALDTHERDAAQRLRELEGVGVTAEELRADFDAIAASLEALTKTQQRVEEARRTASASASRRASAEAALFDLSAARHAVPMQREALVAADALFGKAIEVRAARAAFVKQSEQVRRLPAQDAALPEKRELGQAMTALAEWTKSPIASNSEHATPSAARSELIAAAIILAAVSLTIAALLELGVAAGAISALVMLFIALRAQPTNSTVLPTDSSDAAAVHRSTFERIASESRVQGPREWSSACVAAAITKLIDQIEQRAKQDDAEFQRTEHARAEVLLKNSEAELGAVATDFTRQFGVKTSSEIDHTWITVVINGIRAWQEATAASEQDRKELEDAERVLDASQSATTSLFQSAGVKPDPESARWTIELFTRRLASLRAARQRRDLAETRVQEHATARGALQVAMQSAEVKSAAFWGGLGLSEGDDLTLAVRLKERDRYGEAMQQQRDAEGAYGRAKAKPANHAMYAISDLPRIEAALNAESEQKTQLDVSTNEIAAIEAELKRASEGNDVGDCLVTLARANADLREQEEANAETVIGATLVDWLRTQSRESLAPDVLKRAETNLARFTNGNLRFEVTESDSTPCFIARNGEEQWRSVSQLSSGERVQLLMAVRLAFLEENEQRALPLLLDEVLAASDDERTALIIDTVIEIARTGRQVFYFTAQSDEVVKWQSRIQATQVPHAVFDLREIRELAAFTALPLLPAPPMRRPVLAHGSQSHRQYGEALQVPAPNLCTEQSAESLSDLHVWHVIEDPEILYRTLSKDITRLGQLESLLKSTEYAGLGDARARVIATARAFRVAFTAWRIGRAKTVTGESLAEASGVSDSFRDRVVDLATRVGGDATKMLAALDAGDLKRWREQATLELREWFRDNGYLDERQRNSRDEIRTAMRAALSTHQEFDIIQPDTLDRILSNFPD